MARRKRVESSPAPSAASTTVSTTATPEPDAPNKRARFDRSLKVSENTDEQILGMYFRMTSGPR